MDRAALEALYDATGGPTWVDSTNWKTSTPLGEWYGVETDADGRVTQLVLMENALTGPIPDALASLVNIETLDLRNNALTGSIPDALASLVNLEWLQLGGNALTGPIPDALGSLVSLDLLRLEENNLTGPLPASMTNLRLLEVLYIFDNTGVCAPADEAFQAWLATVDDFQGATCDQGAISVPGAPTGLTLTPSVGALTASWTAPTNDGGSAITGYKVQWESAASPVPSEVTTTATSYNIIGLTNGTTYTTRVAAVNAQGTGAWSADATAVPGTPVPALPPLVAAALALLLLTVGTAAAMRRRSRVPLNLMRLGSRTVDRAGGAEGP